MKLAACFSEGRHDDERIVELMLAAQDVDGGATREVVAVAGGAIGWLRTTDRFAPFPMARRGARGNLLLVSGAPVLIGGALPALLERAVELEFPEATEALTRLDGGFAALFWDVGRRRLAAVTDFLGMQPLFEARERGALLLATEQKGICASGLVDDTPDAAGWGAFFSFGHYIGRRTSLQQVRWAEAGAVTVYDPRPGGGADARRYWRWPEPAPARTVEEADVAGIYRALADSVAGYRQYGQDGVVLMSGGFDSRIVLCLLREAGLRPRTLVVRHEEELDDADGRFAVAAARQLGSEPEVCRPPADFYASDAYRRYLQLSELANPSIGLFIARVSAYVRPDHGAVWEGLAPNAMQRSDRNPEHGGFAGYLARACQSPESRAWQGVRRVFAPDWVREMRERFDELLREEVARYPDDEYGVFEFSVRNRTRNRLGTNPFKVFGTDALPFTPGITRDFYNRVYALSGRVRGLTALRFRLLREHFPEALAVPFCSGAKLVAATPAQHHRLRIARARGRVLKNWYARRALERLGVVRTFSFDVGTVKRDLLASVDLDDPRLDADAARALAGGGITDPVGTVASERLFYWHVKRLVLFHTHAVRERRPAPVGSALAGLGVGEGPAGA